jgi:hypothetical protein
MVFRWRTFKFDQSGMKPGKVEMLEIVLVMLVVDCEQRSSAALKLLAD